MTIACPDCGLAQDVPDLPPWGIASCRACKGPLERRPGRSLDAALALSATTFLLLIPANLLPFLSVGLAGLSRESVLSSGVWTMIQHHWVVLGLGIFLLVVVFPILRFGLLTVTLGAIRLGYRPHWLGPAFRWAIRLDLWSMQDVFLIGAFIGYTRVAARLTAVIGPGGWCFVAAALLSMIAHASLDRRRVWRAIAPDRAAPPDQSLISCTRCDLALPLSAKGGRCPRCGQRLHARKPDAMIRTTALVVAGFVLYFPANIIPLTSYIALGHSQGQTIFYGVLRLAEAGFWPFAVIIFCTSIAFPMFKLLVLSWELIAVRRRSARGLVLRTKLHRLVDSFGRWSNMDPFTLAVFTPLMQFGQLATARTEIGALAFFGVVITTMFASEVFDPRLMWDAVEERR